MGRSRSQSRSRSRSRGRGRRSRSYSRSRSRSDSPESYRVHVSDLGLDPSKREIEKVFEKFGPLIEVWVARNPPCFAFVVYKYKDDADTAIREMDGAVLSGGRIRCSYARPRVRGGGPRRRGGFDASLRCYQCGERGHFSRDCDEIWRQRRRNRERRRSSRRSYSRSPSRGRRSRSRSRGRRSRSKSRDRGRRSSKRNSPSRSRSRSRSRRPHSSSKSPRGDREEKSRSRSPEQNGTQSPSRGAEDDSVPEQVTADAD